MLLMAEHPKDDRGSRRRRLNRRLFLAALGLGAAAAARTYWPKQGLLNPCGPAVPGDAAARAIIARAWEGIEPSRMWDCHVHLLGEGDGESGAWSNPRTDSLLSPMDYLRRLFSLNAGCVHDAPGRMDQAFVERMLELVDAMPAGPKLMLLAFDWYRGEDGQPVRERSSIFIPNAYAERLARENPRHFEWIASIHPYRSDCVEALERAVGGGARAVKWLPASQGIDPASSRCDRFYEALARLGVPLLTHAGGELALGTPGGDALGNPLRVRRALEHGVRVIVAHCASYGDDRDLDQGPNGRVLPSFELFSRLMADARYDRLLYADISSITQVHRARRLKAILERADWHSRLLNGSDYPLPGVMPVYSVERIADLGLLDPGIVPALQAVRGGNPLLFDFALKRSLRWNGRQLPHGVFETRAFFERARA
jgi:uncharacterized protein